MAPKALVRCFTEARLSTYLDHCRGDVQRALQLYAWNTAITGVAWEVLAHVEVALRNALASGLQHRHDRLGRPGSWLDDPIRDLDVRARDDIFEARRRVLRAGHTPSAGQTVSELNFGFWRFLLARRYTTTLWPHLAGAFPHAPNRSRTTVEDLVASLHVFRNRAAHHQRLWQEPLVRRYDDMLTLLGYIDPDLRNWVAAGSRFPDVLAARPTGAAATVRTTQRSAPGSTRTGIRAT
ncbi:hypothetical protein [Micromonospora aurantiaca (nom. illeg.)]|uniref:hypothetical protein n=1 Tax=Micromonospora aurantiaca (nom. illeg.) TaxID=47850 RepID=UPI0033EB602D